MKTELETALELRRTTSDDIRTEEENERLDHLIYGAARRVANPDIEAATERLVAACALMPALLPSDVQALAESVINAALGITEAE